MDLEIGGVYRIHSRNLDPGVWTGRGFIGIRLKFDSTFLDTEYPWEDGGTARLASPEPIGRVPEGIDLVEGRGGGCSACGGDRCYYVRYAEPIQLSKGYKCPGQWVCLDCLDPTPVFRMNRPLYDHLMRWADTDVIERARERWARRAAL